MNKAQVHHLSATADDIKSSQNGGRFFFLPGSSERAKTIADQFDECRTISSGRGHDVHTGKLRFGKLAVDVGSVSTGMGCPSVDIIVNELISLGASRFLRVGTAGSLQPDKINAGDTVISTGAVRDESTSLAYAPGSIPAVPSFALTTSLIKASQTVDTRFAVHAGLVHSKDAFFAREMKTGPLSVQSEDYMACLKSLGVLATEMEASHLFILSQMQSGRILNVDKGDKAMVDGPMAGAVLAVVGGEGSFADEATSKAAIDQAIRIAFEAVRLLYRN